MEGVWRVWRVLEGLEGFGAFGAFAGWQTEALKAHRKPLLWPWPWGACLGSGLGPGVPAGDGVWRVWKVLEGLEGLEGFGSSALKAHRALALGCLLGKWPWPWGACWTRCLEGLDGFGERPEGLEGFGGFGGFGGFWRVVRQDKFHTCGGPRRRPGLGEGRGRRIF